MHLVFSFKLNHKLYIIIIIKKTPILFGDAKRKNLLSDGVIKRTYHISKAQLHFSPYILRLYNFDYLKFQLCHLDPSNIPLITIMSLCHCAVQILTLVIYVAHV